MCDVQKKAPEVVDSVRYDLQDFAPTAVGIAEALTNAASAAKKVLGTGVIVREVSYRPGTNDEAWGTATAHVLHVILKSAPKGE